MKSCLFLYLFPALKYMVKSTLALLFIYFYDFMILSRAAGQHLAKKVDTILAIIISIPSIFIDEITRFFLINGFRELFLVSKDSKFDQKKTMF